MRRRHTFYIMNVILAQHSDHSVVAVHILLYPRIDGADWRGSAAVFTNLLAQCGRQYTKYVGPHTAVR